MEKQLVLSPEVLTQEAFAPFGTVIESAAGKSVEINQGYTTRIDDLARVQLAGDKAETAISYFLARPRPLRFTMLERHPLGSQAFIPLSPAHNWHWWVVVAAAPKADALRLFRASGNQGVQYNMATWHHPLLVESEQTFVVIDRKGYGNNCEEVTLSVPVIAAT